MSLGKTIQITSGILGFTGIRKAKILDGIGIAQHLNSS